LVLKGRKQRKRKKKNKEVPFPPSPLAATLTRCQEMQEEGGKGREKEEKKEEEGEPGKVTTGVCLGDSRHPGEVKGDQKHRKRRKGKGEGDDCNRYGRNGEWGGWRKIDIGKRGKKKLSMPPPLPMLVLGR